MWARMGASQMTEIPVLRATDLQEDGLQGPGARGLSSRQAPLIHSGAVHFL